MFADFHFMRPEWFWALIPALLLLVLLALLRKDSSPWHQLIAPHLQQVILGGQRLIKKQPLALPLLLLTWLLAVTALAGPSWQKIPQPAYALKRATVLVLDMSMSIRATDMTPDRLTQLRFKALDFTEQLTEGELALVTFAGDAFVLSPLTPDHNNVRLLIPDLRPEVMPVQGSNLLAALQQADQLLRQAGYPKGDVVVFTDGFNNGSHNQIMDLLNNWPHRLSIIAFGTEQGAPVRLENGELMKNTQGAVVMPRVPLQQLAQFTRRSEGVFSSATIGDQDLEQIVKLPPLSELNNSDPLQKMEGDQWQDSAIYLVWLLLPLALWISRKAPVILLAGFTIIPHNSEAATWQDLWQTPAQQAQQHYQQQQYTEAQQKFRDPLWQGNAAYRNKDFINAEQAFRQAVDSHGGADALYNLGNALAQQQRYADALEAYQQALAAQPDFPQASHNAELMEKLLQQAENQQENQPGNEDQQSEDSQNDQQQKGQQSSDNQQSQQQDKQGENEEGSANEQQQPANDSADSQSAESQDMQADTQQEQAERPLTPAEQEEAERKTQQAIRETWPNATPEQQQELDNLLRKVQDDPSLLLRNKMYLEYQKRRQQSLPRGVEQEW